MLEELRESYGKDLKYVGYWMGEVRNVTRGA